MNSIPEMIKEYRKSLGFTQEELGRHLNVSSGSVAMWETGKRNPSLRNLFKMGIITINEESKQSNAYEELFNRYCELSNFDKGVLFSMICTERKEALIERKESCI